MRRRAFAVALLGALTICSVAAQPAVPRSGIGQAKKRSVFLEITVPKKGVPPLHVAAAEGDSATMDITDVGKFAFEPTFPKNDSTAVTVAIFDRGTTPKRRLGEVQLSAGGIAVQSKTSPSFGIRVLRVVQPK
jgi:hypothetical protein